MYMNNIDSIEALYKKACRQPEECLDEWEERQLFASIGPLIAMVRIAEEALDNAPTTIWTEHWLPERNAALKMIWGK